MYICFCGGIFSFLFNYLDRFDLATSFGNKRLITPSAARRIESPLTLAPRSFCLVAAPRRLRNSLFASRSTFALPDSRTGVERLISGWSCGSAVHSSRVNVQDIRIRGSFARPEEKSIVVRSR